MELYITRGDWGAHSYILKQNNQALIIDAGTKLNQIEQCVGDDKVVGILITHLHYDHVFYLKDYVNKFKCNVYLYNPDFTKDNSYTQDFRFEDQLTLPKDCYKSISGEISIGDFKINAIHTPGHSIDCMSYLIDDMLFSGDTIFDGCIGRMDLFTSSTDDMKESLQKLSTYKFDVCYPGHGRSSSYEAVIDTIDYYLNEL